MTVFIFGWTFPLSNVLTALLPEYIIKCLKSVILSNKYDMNMFKKNYSKNSTGNYKENRTRTMQVRHK